MDELRRERARAVSTLTVILLYVYALTAENK